MSGVGELLQDAGVGRRTARCFLEHRQLKLLEEDLPQLERRVDVEFLARGAMDLPLETPSLGFEPALQLREALDVDHHPGPLHLGEHRKERHLDFVEEFARGHCLELRLEVLAQAERHVGVLVGVVGRAAHRNLIVGDERARLPTQLFE